MECPVLQHGQKYLQPNSKNSRRDETRPKPRQGDDTFINWYATYIYSHQINFAADLKSESHPILKFNVNGNLFSLPNF